MRVKFWGTRGSLPSPLKPKEVEEKIVQAILRLPAQIDTRDAQVVRAFVQGLPALLRGTAGGNSPCVEVQAGGEVLILDAGSGLRELGIELMEGPCGRGEGRLHLLISHTHWDHIQGFPMFRPAFVPGNEIFIYGIHDLATIFEQQQHPSTWPVSLDRMRAEKTFIRLQPGESFTVGSVLVRTIKNTHPGDSCSYRLEDAHTVLVYASDAEYKKLDEANLQPYVEFFRNADALIFDAQYTLREAWQKTDWGHSSAMIGLDMARAARVKKVLLFHHDPTYSDTDLQAIQSRAVEYQAQDPTRPICEVMVAYENLTLELDPIGAIDMQLATDGEAAILRPAPTFDEYGVGELARQLVRLSEHSTNPIIDLSQVETLTTAGLQSLVALRQQRKDAPIVLASPSDSVRQVVSLSGYADFFAIYPSVETALAASQAREALNLPGQMIQSRYQIECKVGEGALGTVLKATDTRDNRPVALKILSPVLSQATIDRLMHQSQRITTLNHRNIIQVYAWDRTADYAFIVEEFVGGETLQQVLAERSTRLPGDQAIEIALDIARALEYAHNRGIIHGDLKPANVFLTEDGAKLGGFGLGTLAQGHNLLESPAFFPTAAYLAPEQIVGQPLDARTDLYALGVMLYQLFTGQLPFTGSDQEVMHAHLYEEPIPPRELNARFSLSQEHLICKLLAKNPNDRYASAQQARRISGSLVLEVEDLPAQRGVPLVGRERQLQALQNCWEEARAGRGQLVFITGESGIGKTTLAQRVAAQSAAPVQLIGQCQERVGSPAYHLFTDVLRAYFATVPPEFSDQDSQRLLSNFARLIPELNRLLPHLPVPPPLEPEQEQLRLMGSLTRFVKLSTQDRPWFLVLDDLQWADSSSLELLRYLGHHLPSMALMIVGNYRDGEIGPDHPLRGTMRDLSTYPTYRQFPLDRLDQAEVGLLLANIWGQEVPPPLAKKIFQHTGGNPFYVEEVGRGLVDDGLITMQDGHWLFPEPGDVRLPPSVHEAVLHRISHLNQDTQELLRQAAVLGLAFHFDELRQMSGMSEWQALEHLDAAMERQLVQEMPGADMMLGFRHSDIRHVLYEDLSPLRRRMLHRQAGEVLERRAMREPERVVEELAHHFAEAGELDRTVLYGMEAALQAQATYANETALMWYSRTLKMLEQFGPESALQVQELRLSIHQYLGEVLFFMGRYDEALEHYASAWKMFGPEPPTGTQARKLAALCRQTAEVYETRSQCDQALEWLERGLSYLDEKESSVELARIYNAFGSIQVRQGNYAAAQDYHERALSLARSVGLRQVEADSLRALGRPTWFLGDYAGVRSCLEQALPIFREIDDRRGEGSILNNLGVISEAQGDYAAARAYYEQALPIYREIGYRWGEAMTLNNVGVIDRVEGHYTSARALHEQSLAIFCEIGDRWSESLLLNNLGVLALSQGDNSGAQAYLEQALVVKREIGDRGGVGEVLAYLCLLSHRLGEYESARDYGRESRQISQELGDRHNLGFALTFLGHALVALDSWAEAGQTYEQALALRRELGQSNIAMEPLAGLAWIALKLDDLALAQARVEEILSYLQEHSLDGTEEPLRIYLICYRVLQAADDPRAGPVLDAACSVLQRRLEEIQDPAVQRMFLNMRTNRELATECASRGR